METPKKKLSLSKDTAAALRVRTALQAGYLGQNPGNQGRNLDLLAHP